MLVMRDEDGVEAFCTSFRILYQPIFRLADLRTDYVEVLARAETAEGRLIGAGAIVGAMHGSGRALDLTASIMQLAVGEYQKFGFAARDLHMAFNLPLDAMLHPELVARLNAILLRARLPAKNIRFELTEHQPVEDLPSARSIITDLRDHGHTLALDDITPATPNLSALMAMPIRAVKLDRSVVIGTKTTDTGFIRAMVAAATTRGQDVIAEGIETAAQCEAMRRLGVTHGQGFLLSYPLPAAELCAFLQAEAKS